MPNPTSRSLRVPYLDTLVALGRFIEFYDPDANRFPLPTFPYRWAPTHLATTRQLRAGGLRPGGHPVVAQILWRHKKHCRVAYLYDLTKARAKRTATPAQRAAIAKALRARRTCPTCRQERPYYIPRRYGECLDCLPGGTP
jgi:hypothetical protein